MSNYELRRRHFPPSCIRSGLVRTLGLATTPVAPRKSAPAAEPASATSVAMTMKHLISLFISAEVLIQPKRRDAMRVHTVAACYSDPLYQLSRHHVVGIQFGQHCRVLHTTLRPWAALYMNKSGKIRMPRWRSRKVRTTDRVRVCNASENCSSYPIAPTVIVTGLHAWTPSGIVCRSISTQIRRIGGRVLTSVVPSSPSPKRGLCVSVPALSPPPSTSPAALSACLPARFQSTTPRDEAKLLYRPRRPPRSTIASCLLRFCTYTLVLSSLPVELRVAVERSPCLDHDQTRFSDCGPHKQPAATCNTTSSKIKGGISIKITTGQG